MTIQGTAIEVEREVSPDVLAKVGASTWPVWEKGVSRFPWTYDERETCYFLEGRVVVTPEGGTPITVGRGDLVTFPAGMTCTWDIREPVRKHYRFG